MMEYCTQAIPFSFSPDEEEVLEAPKLPYLKIVPQADFTEEMLFALRQGDNVIGRQESCDIFINHPSLSKEHAVIEVDQGDCLLYDRGSLNKTRKGKLVLKPNVRYSLADGDSLYLGNLHLQFVFIQKSNDFASPPRGQEQPLVPEEVDPLAVPLPVSSDKGVDQEQKLNEAPVLLQSDTEDEEEFAEEESCSLAPYQAATVADNSGDDTDLDETSASSFKEAVTVVPKTKLQSEDSSDTDMEEESSISLQEASTVITVGETRTKLWPEANSEPDTDEVPQQQQPQDGHTSSGDALPKSTSSSGALPASDEEDHDDLDTTLPYDMNGLTQPYLPADQIASTQPFFESSQTISSDILAACTEPFLLQEEPPHQGAVTKVDEILSPNLNNTQTLMPDEDILCPSTQNDRSSEPFDEDFIAETPPHLQGTSQTDEFASSPSSSSEGLQIEEDLSPIHHVPTRKKTLPSQLEENSQPLEPGFQGLLQIEESQSPTPSAPPDEPEFLQNDETQMVPNISSPNPASNTEGTHPNLIPNEDLSPSESKCLLSSHLQAQAANDMEPTQPLFVPQGSEQMSALPTDDSPTNFLGIPGQPDANPKFPGTVLFSSNLQQGVNLNESLEATQPLCIEQRSEIISPPKEEDSKPRRTLVYTSDLQQNADLTESLEATQPLCVEQGSGKMTPFSESTETVLYSSDLQKRAELDEYLEPTQPLTNWNVVRDSSPTKNNAKCLNAQQLQSDHLELQEPLNLNINNISPDADTQPSSSSSSESNLTNQEKEEAFNSAANCLVKQYDKRIPFLDHEAGPSHVDAVLSSGDAKPKLQNQSLLKKSNKVSNILANVEAGDSADQTESVKTRSSHQAADGSSTKMDDKVLMVPKNEKPLKESSGRKKIISKRKVQEGLSDETCESVTAATSDHETPSETLSHIAGFLGNSDPEGSLNQGISVIKDKGTTTRSKKRQQNQNVKATSVAKDDHVFKVPHDESIVPRRSQRKPVENKSSNKKIMLTKESHPKCHEKLAKPTSVTSLAPSTSSSKQNFEMPPSSCPESLPETLSQIERFIEISEAEVEKKEAKTKDTSRSRSKRNAESSFLKPSAASTSTFEENSVTTPSAYSESLPETLSQIERFINVTESKVDKKKDKPKETSRSKRNAGPSTEDSADDVSESFEPIIATRKSARMMSLKSKKTESSKATSQAQNEMTNFPNSVQSNKKDGQSELHNIKKVNDKIKDTSRSKRNAGSSFLQPSTESTSTSENSIVTPSVCSESLPETLSQIERFVNVTEPKVDKKKIDKPKETSSSKSNAGPSTEDSADDVSESFEPIMAMRKNARMMSLKSKKTESSKATSPAQEKMTKSSNSVQSNKEDGLTYLRNIKKKDAKIIDTSKSRSKRNAGSSSLKPSTESTSTFEENSVIRPSAYPESLPETLSQIERFIDVTEPKVDKKKDDKLKETSSSKRNAGPSIEDSANDSGSLEPIITTRKSARMMSLKNKKTTTTSQGQSKEEDGKIKLGTNKKSNAIKAQHQDSNSLGNEEASTSTIYTSENESNISEPMVVIEDIKKSLMKRHPELSRSNNKQISDGRNLISGKSTTGEDNKNNLVQNLLETRTRRKKWCQGDSLEATTAESTATTSKKKTRDKDKAPFEEQKSEEPIVPSERITRKKNKLSEEEKDLEVSDASSERSTRKKKMVTEEAVISSERQTRKRNKVHEQENNSKEETILSKRVTRQKTQAITNDESLPKGQLPTTMEKSNKIAKGSPPQRSTLCSESPLSSRKKMHDANQEIKTNNEGHLNTTLETKRKKQPPASPLAAKKKSKLEVDQNESAVPATASTSKKKGQSTSDFQKSSPTVPKGRSPRKRKASYTETEPLEEGPRASPRLKKVADNLNANLLPSSASPNLQPTEEILCPRVMFTGILGDDSKLKMVTSLGGSLATSTCECTHLVTDKFRRTIKTLACIAKGAPIVTLSWLKDSSAARKFLDPKLYLIQDPAAEANFGFCLALTLNSARQESLLLGWSVHITPHVVPSSDQLKEVILCGKGKFLEKMPTTKRGNNSRLVVVSCPEDRKLWDGPRKLGLPIVSSEFLLTGLLKYQLDLDAFAL